MAAIKTGVSIRVGTKTYASFLDADANFQKKLMALKRNLGELTRPFDEVSRFIITKIQKRFTNDSFGAPPFRDASYARSRWTAQARQARSINPNGSTLYATGNMAGALERRDSPTKSPSGGRREVYRLVIGMATGSAPYYKKQLAGGIWDVPVYEVEGNYFLDSSRLEGGAMTSEAFHGPEKWNIISRDGSPTTIPVQVPATNFFLMLPGEQKFMKTLFNKWFYEVGIKSRWGEAA